MNSPMTAPITAKVTAIRRGDREVDLFFGWMKLVLWEANEGLLFLRNKQIGEVIYGPEQGGGMRFIYPINRLGYGIGINAVIIAVSAAAGPTLASFILAIASWPWLFAVKVPIAFLAFAVGLYVLPKTPRASHPFDVVSGLLSAVTFGVLIFFIDASAHDAPPLLLAGEFVLMASAGFVLFRRQIAMPLLGPALLALILAPALKKATGGLHSHIDYTSFVGVGAVGSATRKTDPPFAPASTEI